MYLWEQHHGYLNGKGSMAVLFKAVPRQKNCHLTAFDGNFMALKNYFVDKNEKNKRKNRKKIIKKQKN
jgi:hypothetical protein